MKISNEFVLLLSLLSSGILIALIVLIYCIRKVDPGGETFESWSDEENQEEKQ